jgi:translation initiation factor IF-1
VFYRVKTQEGHKANGKTSGKNHLIKIIGSA